VAEFAYERFAESITVGDIQAPVLTAPPTSTVADVLGVLDNYLNENHQQVFLQDEMECLGICHREGTFGDSPPSGLAIDHCSPNDIKVSECVGSDLTLGEFIETSLKREFCWVVKHGLVLGWVDIFQLESPLARICLFALLTDLDACLNDLLMAYMIAHHLKLELQGRHSDVFGQVEEDFLKVLPEKRRAEVREGRASGREFLNCINFSEKHGMLQSVWRELFDNYGLALGGKDFFTTTRHLRNRLAHGEAFLDLLDGDNGSTHIAEYVVKVKRLRHQLLRYSGALRSTVDEWHAADGPHTPQALRDALKAVPFHME